MARTFRGAPIKSKDGITQIVNWKKMITQSRQVAKRLGHAPSARPWDFKRAQPLAIVRKVGKLAVAETIADTNLLSPSWFQPWR